MTLRERIVRKPESAKIAGVCGAISDLLSVDVKLVRILYLVLTVFTAFFPGILLYLFLMMLFPRETEELTDEQANV